MSYLPKRLIDINLLQNMLSKNPLIQEPNTRLLSYDIPTIGNPPIGMSKIDKQIEKIKNSGIEGIGPSLVNGLVFIVICIIIYSVLYYKYYKKKESNK